MIEYIKYNKTDNKQTYKKILDNLLMLRINF